ncbi:MAG: hypothetical protein AAF497_10875 [Planctomycetota bacterium]
MRQPSKLSYLFLPLLLALVGCNGRSTYNAAYRHAFYATQYDDAVKTGTLEGQTAASRAAELGNSWRFYPRAIQLGLAAGILLGLGLQYGLLAACRRKHLLRSWMVVPFVPGIRHSRCFEYLANRTLELASAEHELERTNAKTNQQLHELEAAYQLARQSLIAAESLDELSRNRQLDLAKRELARIVTLADKKARKWKLPNTYECPFCHRAIRYKSKIAGTETSCPNPECNATIRLPKLDTPPKPKLDQIKSASSGEQR